MDAISKIILVERLLVKTVRRITVDVLKRFLNNICRKTYIQTNIDIEENSNEKIYNLTLNENIGENYLMPRKKRPGKPSKKKKRRQRRTFWDWLF